MFLICLFALLILIFVEFILITQLDRALSQNVQRLILKFDPLVLTDKRHFFIFFMLNLVDELVVLNLIGRNLKAFGQKFDQLIVLIFKYILM
jgi:hypothetical protein